MAYLRLIPVFDILALTAPHLHHRDGDTARHAPSNYTRSFCEVLAFITEKYLLGETLFYPMLPVFTNVAPVRYASNTYREKYSPSPISSLLTVKCSRSCVHTATTQKLRHYGLAVVNSLVYGYVVNIPRRTLT
jgi:hypothetical protein